MRKLSDRFKADDKLNILDRIKTKYNAILSYHSYLDKKAQDKKRTQFLNGFVPTVG